MEVRGSFDVLHGRYEEWFTRHRRVYHSELLAVRALLPCQGFGIEIGVGTGRFAAPLGIRVGVDPSWNMLAYAIKKGILGVRGQAENLPFKSSVFDFALVVTTICFVDDAEAMLLESRRVLKPNAPLVIGFVDRDSALGEFYEKHREEKAFYRDATFYSALDVERLLKDAGFENQIWKQTLSRPLDQISDIDPVCEGHGRGGFVVVAAT